MPEGRCPHGGDPAACQLCNPPSGGYGPNDVRPVTCVHGGDPAACQLCNLPKVDQPTGPKPRPDLPWRGDNPPGPYTGPNTDKDQWDDWAKQQRDQGKNPKRDGWWQDYKQDAYETNAQRKHFFNSRGLLGRLAHGDTCMTCGQPKSNKDVHV